MEVGGRGNSVQVYTLWSPRGCSLTSKLGGRGELMPVGALLSASTVLKCPQLSLMEPEDHMPFIPLLESRVREDRRQCHFPVGSRGKRGTLWDTGGPRAPLSHSKEQTCKRKCYILKHFLIVPASFRVSFRALQKVCTSIQLALWSASKAFEMLQILCLSPTLECVIARWFDTFKKPQC